MKDNPQIKTLAESENFVVWTSTESDEELIYHIEIQNITIHLLPEEWDEFVSMMLEAIR